MDDITPRPSRGDYARRKNYGRPVPSRTLQMSPQTVQITETASTIRPVHSQPQITTEYGPEPAHQDQPRRFSKLARTARKTVRKRERQQKRADKQAQKRAKSAHNDGLLVIRLPKWAARVRGFVREHKLIVRFTAAALALLMIFALGYEFYHQRYQTVVYNFSGAEEKVLNEPSQVLANKLTYDNKTATYQFNQGYSPKISNVASSNNGPKITASFGSGADKTVKITDPVSEVSISLKPRFAISEPKQDDNRVVYPLIGKHVSAVYSVGSIGVKEDLLVRQYQGDSLDFAYDLSLPDGLEARVENDGSLGIYGVQSALLGNVTTSNDKDAELLQKARQNGKKTQLLFGIPKPVIMQERKKVSPVGEASFSLKGNVLTVHAKELKKATYPISIDPTVYVASAVQFMRGNNETNIDFDPTNDLIQKSQTTGARIDAWSSTSDLTSAVYGQGTAVAGGYIYSVGGIGSGTTSSTPITTVGSNNYVVPAGVNYISVKVWGGGGGGGAGTGGSGSGGSSGGNGGGGGYAKAVISVTPGETLTAIVGAGGAKASANGRGGNGGTASFLKRSSTNLLIGGGGGGGAGRRGRTGGRTSNGGAGGGTTGEQATTGSIAPGLGGTQAAGGNGGSGGTGAGANGASLGGGNASNAGAACNTAGSGNGSSGSGGTGGTYTTSCAPGGGGGGGYYGGGGGGSTSTANRTGGGGGGGSSYINGTGLVTGTDVNQVGSGATPGNSGDSDRGGLADGGTGAASAASATDGDSGAIVISYTATGSISGKVYWAKFNPTTNAIDSPNPGTGACTGWCNNTAYDLPGGATLTGLSLIAYNGYLYAIGGSNSGGTPQTSVYIAKLGANGEPQLWHPSGGTPVYWYQDTNLTNARSQFGAAVYNNRIYILGGLTTSSTVISSNTVQYADIKPTGTLSTFSSTGMQALSGTGGGNRYGLTAHIYNNTLYAIGGDATFSGTPVTNVDYSKLNSDGTMNTWVTTSALTGSGRLTLGGSFSTVFGGYIYVNGGCTTVNASGYCTAIATDVQLTSINADGSLAGWNTILNLTNDRFAHTMIAWQGGLYRLGGCRAQDSITGACTNTVLDVDYGVINEEGEASTVADSVGSGTSPCSGSTPYGCDLPGVSTIGNVLNGTAIINGYLYIWGGCSNTTSGCGTVSRGVIYTSIGSDGSLTKPATCGSWTAVDSYCSNTTSLPTGGVGAPGTAVFNGYIYSVGGFTASGSTNSIYYAAPSTTDGTISSWSTASLTGIGAEDVSYPFAFARANPSSAGSTPGNLFILGGCASPGGIGCSSYTDGVYKCTISTAGVPAACSKNPGGTNQQLQIGLIPGDTLPGVGLGAMAGTLYANYIYLMGGLTPDQTDIKTTRYAKIDNNNNIVDASTGSGSGSWTESPNLTFYGRRRGAGFGYNGYLYVVGGYDGSGGGGGVLADIEFAKINVSDGSIGGWTVSSVNINQRWGLNVRVSNSYAYVIGGCVSGSAPTCSAGGQTNSIQTFQIYNNDSGAIKTYTSSSGDFAASTYRWGASSAILNGYLYVAGGCTSPTDCTTAVNDVQYSLINTSDGSIGTWNTATKGISDTGGTNQVRAWGRLVAVEGYLYYLGGQTSTATDERSEIYYAQPSSGDITSWTTASKAIGDTGSGGQSRTKFGVAVWDSRIYVVGGLDGSAAATSTVYVSPKLTTSGGISSNWSSLTAFNVARYGAAVTAYANNLYIFGGIDNSGNYLNDGQFTTIGYKTGTISQSGTALSGSGTSWTSSMVNSTIQYPDGSRATISAYSSGTSLTVSASKTVTAGTIYTIQDGSIGSWSYTTSIPGKIAQAEAFGANGYIYLVGGRSATASCTPKTLVAPVSANTVISSGNNPTGVGDWFETNVKYAGGRYGAAVSYSEGKIYVMGGGCTRPQSNTYSTGTITQSTTTVTAGGGASFSDDLIGGTITYQDASTATVVSVASGGATLTSSVSKTIGTGQTYSIAVPRHYYATVKSQPQVAQYSRMIDTDTDVFPTAWLMNGIDNAIGARWQLKYKSMHDVNPLVVNGSDSVKYDKGTITQSGTNTVTGSGTSWTSALVGSTLVYADNTTTTVTGYTSATSITVAGTKSVSGQNYAIWTLQQNPNEDCGTSSSMAAMTTWGQETNVGNVYTGDVAPYTAKNSGGSNINCARYFYFNVSIDVSQTYGYPEDVNRGPTLSDISLLFTSDPSKRLRHGATFTGGELQPLDTPCRQSVDTDCPLP